MMAKARNVTFAIRVGIGFMVLLAGNGFCEKALAPFVTLKNESGVWWFNSPAGKPFLSFGVNHVEPVYWQSPNNTAFVLETYGSDLFAPDGALRDGTPAAEKWAARVATNFNTWGFNTLGFHNPLSKSLHSAGNAWYVVELDMRVPWGWSMPRSVLTRAFKRNPLDVFSDAFVAAAESNATDLVKKYANDPRVLGYAYTDGPPWTVDDDRGEPAFKALSDAAKHLHPWVLALMSLPAEEKGKQAWLALMKERYPAPEKAGATYACNASSWSELAATTAWTSVPDVTRAAEDSQAFLLRIMRQWYEVRKNAIRKYDQNHLILGDKLNMNRDSKYPEPLRQSLTLMKDYVDVINLQYYGPFEKQRDTLALIYRETHKPILNGDTTRNPLWEDNPPENTSYYGTLGRTYAEDLEKLFALPYYIGWHHCGYMRGLRRPYLVALKQGDQKTVEFYVRNKHTYREGFITELEKPFEPLIKPLGIAFSKCETIHRASATPDKHP
jgi:hypothetical protein